MNLFNNLTINRNKIFKSFTHMLLLLKSTEKSVSDNNLFLFQDYETVGLTYVKEKE